MLMALTIPRQMRDTVIKLFGLDASERRSILDVTRSVQPGSNVSVYEKELAKHLSQYTPEWISKFVKFFFSLYNITDIGDNAHTLARDFVVAIRAIEDQTVKTASEEQFKEFEEFTYEVLTSHDSLGVGAKALRLMLEHEQNFLASEIFSDIRSVFSQDAPEKPPVAAVISHLLRITARRGQEDKSHFISMDYDDLLQLQQVVDRAIKKHKSLSTMLSNFGVHNVELRDSRQ